MNRQAEVLAVVRKGGVWTVHDIAEDIYGQRLDGECDYRYRRISEALRSLEKWDLVERAGTAPCKLGGYPILWRAVA